MAVVVVVVVVVHGVVVMRLLVCGCIVGCRSDGVLFRSAGLLLLLWIHYYGWRMLLLWWWMIVQGHGLINHLGHDGGVILL